MAEAERADMVEAERIARYLLRVERATKPVTKVIVHPSLSLETAREAVRLYHKYRRG